MKVGCPFFCGEFDERIKPAESFYGSHAIARTFLEIPRGSSANAKTFFFRFAELPQTPRQTPRDLREYPQTPRQTPRDLREYPQTPKHFPWDLRNFRKHQSISRETCGSTRKRQGKRRETCGSTRKRQSISRGTCGTSAGQKHFGRLQRAIKDILQREGTSFLRLTHVVHKITYFLLAVAYKMRLKCHRQREIRRKTRFACRRQVEMRFSGLIPYVCP